MKAFLLALVPLICYTFYLPAMAKTPSPDLIGKFDAGDLNLHIECYGAASSHTIVVHSAFNGYGSEQRWDDVINAVKNDARICLYDRANMGKSDSTNFPYSYEQSAVRLHKLLESADIKPPYLMVGHSMGSYPLRFFNDLYPAEVKGILLVDPSQYGKHFNMIEKWRPESENYSAEVEKQRLLELEVYNNPRSDKWNPFRVDLKASELLMKEASKFGDTPFILLWSKGGHEIGDKPPNSWHSAVWHRMASMYKQAIDDMHTGLSTDTTVVYSETAEHDIFYYEPDVVIEQIKAISAKIK